jgi:hypothetical protein
MSPEHEHWIQDVIGEIEGVLKASSGNHGVFNAGSSPDQSPPVYVIDEAVARLRAKGVNASRNGQLIRVAPPNVP